MNKYEQAKKDTEMVNLSDDQIKEIADQLDCGFKCFWNIKTNELVFFPDELKHLGFEEEFWEEEMEKVEEDSGDFIEIEAMDSSESFSLMERFIDSVVTSENLKERLSQALNRPKPFRNFKFEIDNSGDFRQKWFDFKTKQLIEWVKDQVKMVRQARAEGKNNAFI